MTSTMFTDRATSRAHALAECFITFLETGQPPEGLFSPDVFGDVTVPQWRLQSSGPDDLVAVRQAGHPSQGRVPRWRFDPTPTGFVLEVEEEWDEGGDHWYCRELFRADVDERGISELSVYCTGDWDSALRQRHAQEVTLLRP